MVPLGMIAVEFWRRCSACSLSARPASYFLMITLALGQCVWGLAYRWNAVTGGDNGI